MKTNISILFQYIARLTIILCLLLIWSIDALGQTLVQSFPQDEGEKFRSLLDIEFSPDGQFVFTSGLSG